MRRIPPEDNSDAEGEDADQTEMMYSCEQVIIGNRKAKVVQKKEKVRKETNRRIWKKRIVAKKKTCKFEFRLHRCLYFCIAFIADQESSNQEIKSQQSSAGPQLVHGIVFEAEDDSNDSSSDHDESHDPTPQIVTGIVSESELKEEDDNESASEHRGESENISTSHV